MKNEITEKYKIRFEGAMINCHGDVVTYMYINDKMIRPSAQYIVLSKVSDKKYTYNELQSMFSDEIEKAQIEFALSELKKRLILKQDGKKYFISCAIPKILGLQNIIKKYVEYAYDPFAEGVDAEYSRDVYPYIDEEDLEKFLTVIPATVIKEKINFSKNLKNEKTDDIQVIVDASVSDLRDDVQTIVDIFSNTNEKPIQKTTPAPIEKPIHTTINKKSVVMKRAWEIYRETSTSEAKAIFGLCLKMAWAELKK